jgi:hypothetical protein
LNCTHKRRDASRLYGVAATVDGGERFFQVCLRSGRSPENHDNQFNHFKIPVFEGESYAFLCMIMIRCIVIFLIFAAVIYLNVQAKEE